MSSVPNNITLDAQKMLPFSDKDQANFVWHELKRFTTIPQLYLSNLHSGVYGKIPEHLTEPLHELGQFALENQQWIENLLVLYRLANDDTDLSAETVDLTEVIQTVQEHCHDLVTLRQIEVVEKPNTSAKIASSRRYTQHIVQNILVVLLLALQNNSQLTVSILNNSNTAISFSCKGEHLEDPEVPIDKLLDRTQLFQPAESSWERYRLDLQVAQLLCTAIGAKLTIQKSIHTLEFRVDFNEGNSF